MKRTKFDKSLAKPQTPPLDPTQQLVANTNELATGPYESRQTLTATKQPVCPRSLLQLSLFLQLMQEKLLSCHLPKNDFAKMQQRVLLVK
jgi:hypothetical protein